MQTDTVITRIAEKFPHAAALIAPDIIRTAVLESHALNERLDGRVLFKAESLQHTGAFKLRGAAYKLRTHQSQARQYGTVAYSTGNHAQAVAYTAKNLNIDAKIIIPATAPALKIANTERCGAEVILYDPQTQDRLEICAQIARDEGRIVIPPFDDEDIITGQGTVGLELAQDLTARGLTPDAVLCPCGGGGLAAGVSIALKQNFPAAEIYAVEPEGFDDTQRSLASGTRLANDKGRQTICDAIVTPMPGELTFAINSKTLTDALVVDDNTVIAAMREAFHHLKLVTEPGGIVGLAALLSGAYRLEGKTAVVIISGGNIGIDEFMRLMRQDADTAV